MSERKTFPTPCKMLKVPPDNLGPIHLIEMITEPDLDGWRNLISSKPVFTDSTYEPEIIMPSYGNVSTIQFAYIDKDFAMIYDDEALYNQKDLPNTRFMELVYLLTGKEPAVMFGTVLVCSTFGEDFIQAGLDERDIRTLKWHMENSELF
jgi:hypothetical protein